MNRPPGKSDTWWEKHQNDCGGTYVKIAEPELTKQQLKNLSSKARAGRQRNKLDSWVTPKTTASSSVPKKDGVIESLPIPSTKVIGEPRTLTMAENGGLKKRTHPSAEASASAGHECESLSPETMARISKRRKHDTDEVSVSTTIRTQVQCPICDLTVAEENINEHLDELHSS
jgi:hypothetical protein